MNEQESKKRTFVEQIEVAGNELVDRVKSLVEEHNTRRVIIRQKDGDELLSVPLTFGVVAGGLITLAAPLLAALGALAALVTRVQLEVIREVDDTEAASGTASETASKTAPETPSDASKPS